MYNDGTINITYQNGKLHVQIKSSTYKKIAGVVKPSCKGNITFDDNVKETFEFNKKDKEIVWYSGHGRNKWIKGYFFDIIQNLFIRFK